MPDPPFNETKSGPNSIAAIQASPSAKINSTDGSSTTTTTAGPPSLLNPRPNPNTRQPPLYYLSFDRGEPKKKLVPTH